VLVVAIAGALVLTSFALRRTRRRDHVEVTLFVDDLAVAGTTFQLVQQQTSHEALFTGGAGDSVSLRAIGGEPALGGARSMVIQRIA
jgi:hypothetical protein